PENVSFEHELAALGSRALAWLVDMMAIVALILGASMAVGNTLAQLGAHAMKVFSFIRTTVSGWGITCGRLAE
ncbi:MAG: hypothetical protein ACK6DV_28825, partial [Deltaproteobacteria bacterium]